MYNEHEGLEFNLVTQDELDEIIKGKHYTEVGDKFKQKVVDLQWLTEKIKRERAENKMSPFIDILPVKEDKNKNITQTFPYAKDISSGILFGEIAGMYEDGNIKWRKITIIDHLNLNLNFEHDLRQWALLRYWPKIKGSPWQISEPVFRVYDPEMEANKSIIDDDALLVALTRIKSMKGKSMVWFARSLGINVIPGTSPKVLRSELSKYSKNDAVSFNKYFDAIDRDVNEVFANAKDLGIIKYDLQMGYMYQRLPIGGNEGSAIQYLKENPEVMRNVHRDIENLDRAGKELELAEPADEKEDVKKTKAKTKEVGNQNQPPDEL